MLLAHWHSSQIYTKSKFVLVTESPCGESDGLVLLLGSPSNFTCEYLLSPYVRMVIIYIFIYFYIFLYLYIFYICIFLYFYICFIDFYKFIYLLLLFFAGLFMVSFVLGFFCRGHRLNPNLLGAVTARVLSGGYTSWNNALRTRVTTLLYTLDSHSFFTDYSICFMWRLQNQLLELV